MKTKIITGFALALMLMATPFVAAQNTEEQLLQQGDNYLNGIDTEMDYAKAFQVYQQLAAMENPEAMNRLASMYRQGLGTEQDLGQAVIWYQKAADMGLGKATYNLGNMIKQGEGIEQDFELAFEFFLSAYVQGYMPAAYPVGYCYFKGLGVAQDYTKALEYFQAGADAGHPNCSYFAGLCYIGGYGVAQDINIGKQYMEQALAMGSDPALGFIAENRIADYLPSSAHFARGNRPQAEPHKRRANTAKKELSGEWTGTLLTYDWAGKRVENAKNLMLNFQFDKGKLSGTWIQEDSIAMTVTAALKDSVWVFDNMQYLEQSLERPWEVRSGSFQIKTENGQQILEGTIEQFSPQTLEPAPPVAIQLTRVVPENNNSGAAQALNNSLTVSPNPFDDELNIQFTLEKQQEVNIKAVNMAGQILYSNTAVYAEGANTQKLQLGQAPAGAYTVSVKGKTINLSTLVIKKH